MNTQTVVAEALKVSPPVACIVCDYVTNVDNDIKVLTLIYIVIQIAYLVAKWIKEPKGDDKDDSDE